MKKDFIIKLKGRQYAKGRGRLVFMLLCFVVALIILMLYSSKYFIALLAPVFYLILRLRNISAEKNSLVDAVCTVAVYDFGMELSIKSTQAKLCETHNILYSNVTGFTVNDRKVTLNYNENKKQRNRKVEFHILSDDVAFWDEMSRKFKKTEFLA